MSELPEKYLLRRGEVVAFLGVNKHVFAQLVASGVLKPVYLRLGTRAFFKRAEVLEVAKQTKEKD